MLRKLERESMIYNERSLNAVWKYAPREKKVELLSVLGYNSSWADTKSIPELKKRGGGMVAKDLRKIWMKRGNKCETNG